ncbi:MAG: hypothetical protein U0992_11290 [Planctomycetaceae bacterium]
MWKTSEQAMRGYHRQVPKEVRIANERRSGFTDIELEQAARQFEKLKLARSSYRTPGH